MEDGRAGKEVRAHGGVCMVAVEHEDMRGLFGVLCAVWCVLCGRAVWRVACGMWGALFLR